MNPINRTDRSTSAQLFRQTKSISLRSPIRKRSKVPVDLPASDPNVDLNPLVPTIPPAVLSSPFDFAQPQNLPPFSKSSQFGDHESSSSDNSIEHVEQNHIVQNRNEDFDSSIILSSDSDEDNPSQSPSNPPLRSRVSPFVRKQPQTSPVLFTKNSSTQTPAPTPPVIPLLNLSTSPNRKNTVLGCQLCFEEFDAVHKFNAHLNNHKSNGDQLDSNWLLRNSRSFCPVCDKIVSTSISLNHLIFNGRKIFIHKGCKSLFKQSRDSQPSQSTTQLQKNPTPKLFSSSFIVGSSSEKIPGSPNPTTKFQSSLETHPKSSETISLSAPQPSSTSDIPTGSDHSVSILTTPQSHSVSTTGSSAVLSSTPSRSLENSSFSSETVSDDKLVRNTSYNQLSSMEVSIAQKYSRNNLTTSKISSRDSSSIGSQTLENEPKSIETEQTSRQLPGPLSNNFSSMEVSMTPRKSVLMEKTHCPVSTSSESISVNNRSNSIEPIQTCRSDLISSSNNFSSTEVLIAPRNSLMMESTCLVDSTCSSSISVQNESISTATIQACRSDLISPLGNFSSIEQSTVPSNSLLMEVTSPIDSTSLISISVDNDSISSATIRTCRSDLHSPSNNFSSTESSPVQRKSLLMEITAPEHSSSSGSILVQNESNFVSTIQTCSPGHSPSFSNFSSMEVAKAPRNSMLMENTCQLDPTSSQSISVNNGSNSMRTIQTCRYALPLSSDTFSSTEVSTVPRKTLLMESTSSDRSSSFDSISVQNGSNFSSTIQTCSHGPPLSTENFSSTESSMTPRNRLMTGIQNILDPSSSTPSSSDNESILMKTSRTCRPDPSSPSGQISTSSGLIAPNATPLIENLSSVFSASSTSQTSCSPENNSRNVSEPPIIENMCRKISGQFSPSSESTTSEEIENTLKTSALPMTSSIKISTATKNKNKMSQVSTSKSAPSTNLLKSTNNSTIPGLFARNLPRNQFSAPTTLPSWNEIFSANIPTRGFIPTQAISDVSKCLIKLMEIVLSKNEDHLWKKFFSFPKCIFNPFVDPKKSFADNIKERIQRFEKDDQSWDSLWKETLQKSKSTKNGKNKDWINLVIKKVEDGNVSSAFRVLSSAPNISVDLDVIQKLEELHPSEERFKGKSPGLVLPSTKVNIKFDFEKIIKSFPPGTAAGPDGWRVQHFIDVLRTCPAGSHLDPRPMFSKIVETFISSGFPSQLVSSARLIPLPKKDSGIRPIAIGNVWRRLTAKVVLKSMLPKSLSLLKPQQLGVGISGGAEHICHAVRLKLNENQNDPKFAILQVDFKNAFNRISRPAFLQVIKSKFPQFWKFLSCCYLDPPSLFVYGRGDDTDVIKSENGVQQGDPLGPLLFSLVIDILVKKISSNFPNLLNLWYLDDGHILGDINTLPSVIKLIQVEGENLGLSMNLEKSKLFFPALNQNNDLLSLFPPTLPVVDEGISVLGVPIGGLDFINDSYTSKLKKTSESLGKLVKLDDPQVAFKLVSGCLSLSSVNYFLRCSPPSLTLNLSKSYDSLVLSALSSILGTPFSKTQIQQIELPMKLSGLGIRSAVKHRDAAFISSINSSREFLESIKLKVPAKNEIDHSFHFKKVDLLESTQQKVISEYIDKSLLAKLKFNSSVGSCARINSSMGNHGGLVLNAPLSKHRGFRLTKQEFISFVSLRLGLPLTDHQKCSVCRSEMDRQGIHCLLCKFGPTGPVHRHNEIRDCIFKFCNRALFSASKEVFTGEASNKTGADVLVQNFSDGKPTAFDITIVHPLSKAAINGAAKELGFATKLANKKKIAKHKEDCLKKGFDFLPLSLETFGFFSSNLISVIDRISTSIANRENAPRTEIKHEISRKILFSLVRSSSIAISRRAGGRAPR